MVYGINQHTLPRVTTETHEKAGLPLPGQPGLRIRRAFFPPLFSNRFGFSWYFPMASLWETAKIMPNHKAIHQI